MASYLREHMDKKDSRHLPDVISLFADLVITPEMIWDFTSDLVDHLTSEIRQRRQRVREFLALGLLTQDDIGDFLMSHTDSQPWACIMVNMAVSARKTSAVNTGRHRAV